MFRQHNLLDPFGAVQTDVDEFLNGCEAENLMFDITSMPKKLFFFRSQAGDTARGEVRQYFGDIYRAREVLGDGLGGESSAMEYAAWFRRPASTTRCAEGRHCDGIRAAWAPRIL